MSNPFAEYETAITEIKRCTDNATHIYAVVRDAAHLLRDWKTASVTSVPGDAVRPDVATISPALTISGATWPTAAQIARTLADWHFAKQLLAPEAIGAVVGPARTATFHRIVGRFSVNRGTVQPRALDVHRSSFPICRIPEPSPEASDHHAKRTNRPVHTNPDHSERT